MKTALRSVVILLSLSALSCGDGSIKNTEVKSAGQSLYESNCTSCHGTDGKLGTLGAKDLSASTMTPDEMKRIISEGKNTMTPFKTMMTPEEISEVIRYVQTLKK